jgi:hypothetical protein
MHLQGYRAWEICGYRGETNKFGQENDENLAKRKGEVESNLQFRSKCRLSLLILFDECLASFGRRKLIVH